MHFYIQKAHYAESEVLHIQYILKLISSLNVGSDVLLHDVETSPSAIMAARGLYECYYTMAM